MQDKRGGTPERVGEILARAMKEAGIGKPGRGPDLDAVWLEVAGPVAAGASRITSLRSGVMTVDVTSAALRQELEIYRRDELLQGLRERLGGQGPDRISFRLV